MGNRVVLGVPGDRLTLVSCQLSRQYEKVASALLAHARPGRPLSLAGTASEVCFIWDGPKPRGYQQTRGY